ncbi:IS200/IS605 family accessory protein TnpB-related protein [Candidatus Pacearchaeota archaeon]|nr:IS200/IS605 family accessory protein TnpB-related protein [Candidatus Pacearchaeota archaeon]
MVTRALKLKIEPTRKQHKILDEMFWKWASIANRYNRYTYSKNLGESTIKEKLKPKQDIQTVQFSETMVNQRAKQDNADLKRAMEEQGKQKEEELKGLEERKLIIERMLNDKDEREINPQRPVNIRPKGWFKFHNINHWQREFEKLEKQIKRKKNTIKKIEEGKIYFKPKRVSFWSNNWKISFKSKKLILKPSNSQELILDLITEPIQPHKSSSLRSKEFLEYQISDFLNFSLHSLFFGLASNEGPLVDFKIYDKIVIPKPEERFPKKESEEGKKLDSFDKRVEEYYSDKLEKKIERKLNTEEKNVIDREKTRIWGEVNKLEEIRSIIDEINEIKKQKHISEKSKLLGEKWKKVNNIQETLLSQEYVSLISNLSDELTNKKKELLAKKYSKFDDKIKKIKEDYGLEFDENTIKKEGEKAFLNPDKFSKYQFSSSYLKLIGEIARSLITYKGFLDLNKYPIIFRKPINKVKKIHNLEPDEWKYYIQFGYEQINNPKLETENILGIDRGLTHILAYSVFEPRSSKFILNKLEPNPIEGWKWKLRKLRRSIQNLERRWRAQDNVKLPENQMKKNLRSIEDKVENLYHNLSRKIVDLAKEKNACIVFEKLEGQGMKQHGRKKSDRLRGLNYKLSLFDYGKIAKLIKYKAEIEGIPIYRIDSAYTSQNCAKCVLESRRFAQPEEISCLDDFKEGDNLDKRILEGTGLVEAKIYKKLAKKIFLTAKNKSHEEVKLQIEVKPYKIIISKGTFKLKEKKEDFEIEEDIAMFDTKKVIKENKEKTVILDYVYTRRKEIIGTNHKKNIKGIAKYTGNTKIGYCMKHGQVDADLNASRTIALCKNFDINNPEIWK